jgi:ABC-type branched-subunit amino acid transport system substrate-binding protein
VPDDALKIGLLLALSGPWKAGRTIPGAAALAVQAINADPSLLGGMRVEFTFEDVGCRTYKAVTGVQNLLSDTKIDAIFGPGKLSQTSGSDLVQFMVQLSPAPCCAGCEEACEATVRRLLQI